MIPRGLTAAVGIGVVAGAVFGLLFGDFGDANTLEFVNGTSLSIAAEKTDFQRGEPVRIRIVNSGTVPLSFPDASYGLRIIQLDGLELYSPDYAPALSVLAPREEAVLVWDQIKNDGDAVLHGTYKIISGATDANRTETGASLAINIFK